MSWLFFICSFLFFTSVYPSIHTVHSFLEIEKLFSQASDQDLVIFDVDNLLLIPKDKVFRPCGEHFFLSYFKKYSDQMNQEQVHSLISKLLLLREVEVVDEKAVALIDSLKKRGTKVIALTVIKTGQLGEIPSVEEWRIRELKALGFNFTSTFPECNHIVFGDLVHDDCLPIFKDGVLFSAKLSKEEILHAYLKKIKFRPNCVYFVDDEKACVLAVDNFLQAIEVKSVCVHYSSLEILNEQLDEELAGQQLDQLIFNE